MLVPISLNEVIRYVKPMALIGSFGIKNCMKMCYDKIDKLRGMDIVFVTTAKTDEEGHELLAQLGMPFHK